MTYKKNFGLRKSEVYFHKEKTVSNVIENVVEHDIHVCHSPVQMRS